MQQILQLLNSILSSIGIKIAARFKDYPNLQNLITIPIDNYSVIFLVLVFVILLFIAISIVLWDRFKIPNSQALTILGSLGKDVKTSIEYRINNAEIKANKSKKKVESDEQLEIQLLRTRINMTASEYKEYQTMMMFTALGVMAIGLVCSMMLSVASSPVFALLLFVAAIVTAVIIAYKGVFKHIHKLKQLKFDIIYDLYYFLSTYKYADQKQTFFNFVREHTDKSNSLKVDFKMLISDMNSYTNAIALDNFKDRADMLEISRLVSLIKSTESGTISPEQFKISVQALSDELREIVLQREAAANSKRMVVMILILLLAFTSLVIVMMLPEIIEVIELLTAA